MSVNSSGSEGWVMNDNRTQKLLDKIRKQGVPLSEYVGGKIYYGIKTGLNEAFVIDSATRDRLIAEDPKSAEVIKPFLAGRDIKRYRQPVSDKYLIFFANGWTKKQYGNLSEDEAFAKLRSAYSAIADHLIQFKTPAKLRQDKGQYWWELRACDYYGEFEKPKIIVPSIVKAGSYSLDENGIYSNDKTSIIITSEKYLLALLNSRLIDYVLKQIASTKQGGYFEYKPMYVSQLPIYLLDDLQKKQLNDLVGSLLALAPSESAESKSKIESEIDRLVYELYGLTEEEITIVEGD
jgi:hypothetical protein